MSELETDYESSEQRLAMTSREVISPETAGMLSGATTTQVEQLRDENEQCRDEVRRLQVSIRQLQPLPARPSHIPMQCGV